MSLHPEILFHFTDRDGLLKILEHTFKISYARERIQGRNETREFGIPMVSFCDIKLSDLKDHIDKYGDYGIGLNKSWANSKGLNPVWYVNKNSEFPDGFTSALNALYRQMDLIIDDKEHKEFNKNYMKFMDTYRYLKNYEGDLKRSGFEVENYRFADEKEWRFVPSINEEDILPLVPITRIRTKQQKKEYNDKISHLHLSFEPKDIKYIIVKNDNDILDIINHLKIVKNRFSPDEVMQLQTRILTTEQIKTDM
ncbi:abortive infection system antitoxin AbiGi family protein [Phytobacter diazotrophicus]|uniref:abortive infection system antitoxin AbiGi family protein n=1 Tax=Phytobacter diazotrophicus TaxID=395631 RepID=UPI002FFB645E